MVFYFLSLAICFILWGWPCIYLLTGKIFPYTHCGRIFLWMTLIFTFVEEYFCSSSYWLLRWIVLFIAFLASCTDPIFQLVVFSVVNKIGRVMIPCAVVPLNRIYRWTQRNYRLTGSTGGPSGTTAAAGWRKAVRRLLSDLSKEDRKYRPSWRYFRRCGTECLQRLDGGRAI